MAIGTVGYPSVSKSSFDPVGSFQEGQSNSLAAEMARKNIAKAELVNKYFPTDKESEYALAKAQAELANANAAIHRQDYADPALRSGTDFEKELAYQRRMGNDYRGEPQQAPQPQPQQQQPFYSPTNGMTPEQLAVYQQMQQRQTPQQQPSNFGMPPQMAGATPVGAGAPVAAAPAYSPIQDAQQIQQAQALHEQMKAQKLASENAQIQVPRWVNGKLIAPADNAPGQGETGGRYPYSGQPEGQPQAQQEQRRPMTQREMQQRHLENMLAQQEAEIAWKKSGGSSMGVNGQLQRQLIDDVMMDNPSFTPQQAWEASSQLQKGLEVMPDGRPFNVSENTRTIASANKLKATSAQLISRGVQANQAAAEIPVADKYISQGMSHYGTTFNDYSPGLAADSMKTSDDAAQTRVGQYYAAKLLNYDKAALMTRVNGIESGQAIIEGTIKEAQQQFSNEPLIKTAKARQVALETVTKATKEMLQARNKVGVSATSATGNYAGSEVGSNMANRGSEAPAAPAAPARPFKHLSDAELEKIANG